MEWNSVLNHPCGAFLAAVSSEATLSGSTYENVCAASLDAPQFKFVVCAWPSQVRHCFIAEIAGSNPAVHTTFSLTCVLSRDAQTAPSISTDAARHREKE